MQVIYVNSRRMADASILNIIRSALNSLDQFSWQDQRFFDYCEIKT
jgi:hypothetical protein